MPWKECHVMVERLRFVARLLEGEKMAPLYRVRHFAEDRGERLWLVTFMQYDLDYFDDETCRLEPIENPFGPKVLPMSSE